MCSCTCCLLVLLIPGFRGRYMVVLRLGGVYADVDTQCRQPLNSVIQPRDTLVVSWENDFPTAEEARRRAYVRKRQVCCSFPVLPPLCLASAWLHPPGFLLWHSGRLHRREPSNVQCWPCSAALSSSLRCLACCG